MLMFVCCVSRRNNVPEGAYVEWVIELLGFEMQKVKHFIVFLVFELMHLELWMSHFSGVFCIICRIGLVWILELL